MKYILLTICMLALTACGGSKVLNMATINQLTAVDTVEAGDQIPIYDASNGDARKASMTVLQTFMQDNLVFDTPDDFTTMHPVEVGAVFIVNLTGSDNIFVILISAASATVYFQYWFADDIIVDKQEVLFSTVDAISAFSHAAGAPTVIGFPSSLAAGEFFKMRYDLATDTWYRVG